MSEVINSSENQENSVLAQNETGKLADTASIAEVAAAAKPSEQVEASPTPIPVTNNSAKAEASPTAAAAKTKSTDDGAVDVAAAETSDKAATADTAAASVSSPKVENKKTPAKRTPSKRMSFIERAQKESEELVKNLGGSLELEGGRRTRSSTRGTPTRSSVVATPPPTKKARSSPATSSSPASATPSRRGGRGRKIDTSIEPEPEETEVTAAKEENKQPESEENDSSKEQPQAATADNNDSEKSSVENAENSVVDAANSAAAAEEAEETAKIAKKQEKKSVAVDEDNTDAVLETIPEEKQNNIDHDSPEIENKANDDSSKDVNKEVLVEAKLAEAAAESEIKTSPTTKSVESANIEKLPTPEPMEVDSSNSKDNDIAPNLTGVERMEVDATETADITAALPTKEEKTVPSSEPTVVETKNLVKTVNDLKSATVPGIIDASAAGEPQATEAAKDTNATNEHKSKSDLSEPKIASPTSTDGAVTATPQSCN